MRKIHQYKEKKKGVLKYARKLKETKFFFIFSIRASNICVQLARTQFGRGGKKGKKKNVRDTGSESLTKGSMVLSCGDNEDSFQC